MMAPVIVGDFVAYPESPGIGSVGAADGAMVRVDFFNSIATPVARSAWVPSIECVPVRLDPATRVYWRNPDTGRWLPGRVTSGSRGEYFVNFPNHGYDFPIPQVHLRVRWDGGRSDPLAVLGVGAHESGYFRNTRLPFLEGLVAQRGASASSAAFLSSAVEIYPHQVDAAFAVLSDPVQRYLLADEVGLGKTVQAGYVIRQTLLDDPRARVVVLTPESLRRQWVEELLSKFFIDDFAQAKVKFRSHDDPGSWADHHDWDLLVVDEAHRITQVDGPTDPTYASLCALAHSVPRVLLLSATPTTSHYTTHLGLLHLLDPDLYPWEKAEQFAERYRRRIALADSIYSLDAQFSVFLDSSIEEVREILGESDPLFENLAARVLESVDEDGGLRSGVAESDLAVRVEELRAHLSETYRLHRRIIRHRRATVLTGDPDGEFAGYEVRGRRPPVVLGLDSEAHDVAEGHLLGWQQAAADHLAQEGSAGDRGAHGGVLRVLASRTGVIVDDLLDSLRWRVRSDRTAADRAGLTADERRALRAAPPLPFEPELVLQMETHDDVDIRRSALDSACRAVARALRKGRRAAFFCGPGQLGELFAAHLRRRFPQVVVGTHTSSVGSEAAHDAVRMWSTPIQPEDHARLLILDGSGEDGLNLQLAHSAFHLRLPWSPNLLEQRLGRLDRYRGVDAVSQSAPAEQYRLGSAHGETSIGDAWADLLTDGYEVFDQSMSPLQDAIVDGIDDVWTQALDRGPAGLHACTGSVLTGLEAARVAIEKMDLLESIHDQPDPDAGVAGRLNRFETDWARWRVAFHAFTSEHDGGIRVRHRSTGEVESYDVVNSRPAIDPHHWRRMRAGLTPAVVNGVFNRSVSLRKQGIRLFRSGNPLTDALANWAWQDDRGQATAFSRPYAHQTGGAEPYFGLDYLVSADTGPAVDLSLQDARVERALRRQADRLLPPFIVRVWVPAFSRDPVVDEGQRQWLDRPYDKDARDRNYSGERLQEFFDIFGGQDEYQSCLTDAEGTGRAHMAEVTDLARRCSEAQAAAEQRMAVALAQAKARSAAGHLVGDVESYLVDTEVTAALVGGLSRPTTELIAAVCVVRVPGVFRGR